MSEPSVCDRTVLVVEDDEAIREAVVEVLRDDGYRVNTAKNGADAIEVLDRAPPPCVVLVDLMMPVMTGWELVTRMRSREALASVPVVVTSAASDRSPPGVDRVLQKPISLNALLSAVNEFCGAGAAASADEHERVVRELARRNIELAELQRLRDEMSALVVHDIKNPLSVVLTTLQWVLGGAEGADEEERREALVDALSGAQRIERLVVNLLDLVKMETGGFLPRRVEVGAPELVEPLVRRSRRPAQARGIHISSTEVPAVRLAVDRDLVARALENVIENAIRPTPGGGRIEVRSSIAGDRLRIAVGNTGRTISPDVEARLFDKFGRGDAPAARGSLGLGLYFCRLAAEAHGGRIALERTADLPTVFVLEIPI